MIAIENTVYVCGTGELSVMIERTIKKIPIIKNKLPITKNANRLLIINPPCRPRGKHFPHMY